LTEYNTLHKFVTTQRDGLCQMCMVCWQNGEFYKCQKMAHTLMIVL